MPELSKAYEPQKYEDAIYKQWEQSGLFAPEKSAPGDVLEHFSVVLPPPNVTGTLHMGHAAMLAIEDVMVRYHRMKGDRTLWVPGTDHAAVATESKVEAKLIKEEGMKKPKEELGREAFLARVHQFAQDSHDTIVNQAKKMGSSLDWSREAYTLDEVRSQAVRLVFKKMYDDGLIYRGYRVINWSVKGQSTCSDDELVYVERPAKLYYFKYSKDFPITIATTRPETKLGDTAVAVNPNDDRYKQYIGKTFVVDVGAEKPLNIKIIASDGVDPSFGTGALGVTPAHSTVDFEMYLKQKEAGDPIELIQVIGEDGCMMSRAGTYAGLTIFKAREQFVEHLRSQGLLEKEEDITQNVGTSDRFGDVVEALPKTQWFVDVNKKFTLKQSVLTQYKAGDSVSLKELMQSVVANKEIKIVPERFEKTYFSWINNLRDWCISRQIWFGHRIPVWYKSVPRLSELSELKKNSVEKQPGADSPVAEKKDPEYRFVLASEDWLWIQKNVVFTGERSYADFFDGRTRTRVDNGVYVTTAKSTSQTGVVVKRSKYGIYQDHNVFVEERVTSGFCRYEIEFKDILPDYFKNRPIISSTDILSYQKHDQQGTALYVGSSNPQFSEGWTQDPDTLDTWFSSGLWTFSTLLDKNIQSGESLEDWVARSADIKKFHPTSVLETGYDIIFFWVARMILMTTYALGDVPFKTVYLHGLVRDEQGRKMSKSLGNIINPLDMIEKFGTDATRLSLLLGSTPGNDVKLSEEKIAGFRNFTNKLWNIARFMLLSIEKPVQNAAIETTTLSDAWIITRLERVRREVTHLLETSQFSAAGERLREFTWTELADWYLEVAKIEGEKAHILNAILNTLLKLWHPFMPFVTEAIWREMYGETSLLLVERWPSMLECGEIAGNKDYFDNPSWGSTGAEQSFSALQEIITVIRTARAEQHIEPVKRLRASITTTKKGINLIKNNADVIKQLTRLEDLNTDTPGTGIALTVGEFDIRLDTAGAVDVEKEKTRLTKDLADVERFIAGLSKKLDNAEFVKNAPPHVVEMERKKFLEATEKSIRLHKELQSLA